MIRLAALSIRARAALRGLAEIIVLCMCAAVLLGTLANAATPGADDGVSPVVQAERVVEALEQGNYAAVAEHVDPARGLGFSPYSRDLSTLFVARVARGELALLATSRKLRNWGTYDGIGGPIRLVPSTYHRKFVYDADYRKVATRTFLTSEQLMRGAGWSALVKAYPGASVVRFDMPGTANLDYKDRKALLLIFVRSGHRWVLAGIAHDEDTV